MNERDDKEKELERRERELKQKEREIRLRELETEIYQQQEPPLYETKKHEKPEGKFSIWKRKATKIAKFVGFTVAGIAIMRVGMFVGMWLTWGLMALIVAFIAYRVFLEDNDRDR